MDNAPQRIKTWRVLRTQALVEIDSPGTKKDWSEQIMVGE